MWEPTSGRRIGSSYARHAKRGQGSHFSGCLSASLDASPQRRNYKQNYIRVGTNIYQK
jgi:pectin methylesterase-like acyl-CoA thioesterase